MEAGTQRLGMGEVLAQLVRLVGAALDLPDVEPTGRQYDELTALDTCYQQVGRNAAEMAGDRNVYWKVFDPREHEEPLAGSLTDDLGDIYRDLHRGLCIARLGEISDACWDWRFNFEIHWGNHATDAIRVLHRLTTS